ncbi:hypothetical protein BJX64DRAFT_260046 [Aspergillus heterothallicus]
MSSTIPLFYRFYFLWYEPLACLLGVYAVFGQPTAYLNSYIPTAITETLDLTHKTLLTQMGAAFLYVGLSQGLLLRYTSDVGVWKMLNLSLLGWDAILLWGLWDGLSAQGRLSLDGLRGNDLQVIVITAVTTIVRAVFVAGVGLRSAKVVRKEL